MNKSMIAGIALATGVAIAAPTLGSWAAEDQPRIAQAEPDQHAMGGMDEHGFRGREGHEGMGHHGWMREMMTRRSPKERCEERLAHRAGIIAYLGRSMHIGGGSLKRIVRGLEPSGAGQGLGIGPP